MPTLKRTLSVVAVVTVGGTLSGCIDPLVGLAVNVGGTAILAGIDAATSPGAPEVEAYCWDPEKQSASTSTSPNCWSPQVSITEGEYEKYRRTGVPPSINASLAQVAKVEDKSAHCVNPRGTYFYTMSWSECASGDTKLPADEWQRRKDEQTRKEQVAAAEPVYCWDSIQAIGYELTGGSTCGNNTRISKEQFETQRLRREEAAKQKEETKPTGVTPNVENGAAKQPDNPPSAVTQSETPPAEPTDQASIVPVEIDLERFEIESSGTGFFVSPSGHLVTNHHVVAKCTTMAMIAGGGFYEAKIVDSNDRLDLALLKTPFSVDRFARFAADMPAQGDDVFVVGYPLLEDFREIKITNGIVSGLSGPDHDTTLLQMTAAVQPGNSGGPLVNQSGQVVGVVVSKYSGEVQKGVYAEALNFAISHEAAIAFLTVNRVEFKRSNSTKELKNRDIMSRTSSWTVPLLCLSKRASG